MIANAITLLRQTAGAIIPPPVQDLIWNLVNVNWEAEDTNWEG